MNLKVIGTGSKGNSYLFKPNSGKSLIIDCGMNFKEVLKSVNFNISSVAGALQSHSHGDHSKYTKDFLNAGIKVFMSEENQKEIKIKHHNVKIIKERQSFVIGDFKILPFDVKHDVKCLGFLIDHPECGKTLFLTDTFYCKYTFPGLNNIIIEANFSKDIIDRKLGPESGKEFLRNRILQSHFSLDNCKDMLAANDLSKVNNILLIHLSDGNSDEVQFQNEVFEQTRKNVLVANNGMDIPFNKTPF